MALTWNDPRGNIALVAGPLLGPLAALALLPLAAQFAKGPARRAAAGVHRHPARRGRRRAAPADPPTRRLRAAARARDRRQLRARRPSRWTLWRTLADHPVIVFQASVLAAAAVALPYLRGRGPWPAAIAGAALSGRHRPRRTARGVPAAGRGCLDHRGLPGAERRPGRRRRRPQPPRRASGPGPRSAGSRGFAGARRCRPSRPKGCRSRSARRRSASSRRRSGRRSHARKGARRSRRHRETPRSRPKPPPTAPGSTPAAPRTPPGALRFEL